MNPFLKSLLLFILPLLVLVTSGIFLPATPREKKSLIFSSNFKDSLLQFTKKPRILIVGGSNASFGINSQLLKDSLHLNPINTGITGGVGLKYMLENTLTFIQKGDYVLLSLDYNLYSLDYAYVSDELLRLIFDAGKHKTKFLSFVQFKNLLEFYIPKFSLSKFEYGEYVNIKDKETDVYGAKSYNKYGDAVAHWKVENSGFEPIEIKGDFNLLTFAKIKEFKKKAEMKGATVLVTHPSIDSVSYVKSKIKIGEINNRLKLSHFIVLGNVEEYILPSSMIFDHPYHLTKSGSFCRTHLLIKDFNRYLSQKK